jgi:hypothetical protein
MQRLTGPKESQGEEEGTGGWVEIDEANPCPAMKCYSARLSISQKADTF